MKSKWFHLKPEAILLRKQGKSLPYIHAKLSIPKSTLSSWLKYVVLTNKQKMQLHQARQDALIKARKGAVLWHNEEKAKRMQLAEIKGLSLLKEIDINDTNITELVLAILYLGEGTKTKCETSMGSSDPLILKFFIACLRKIYHVPEEKIKCELHLRADQNPQEMIEFWSNELHVTKKNFTKPYLDKRTTGKMTYTYYKGVCLVRCGNVAIQRKLVYIAKQFCSKIAAK